MSEKQTEALQIAQRLDWWVNNTILTCERTAAEAAAELRSLEAENEALRDVLRYIANVGEPWQRDYLIREIQAAADAALLGKDSAVIAKDTSR